MTIRFISIFSLSVFHWYNRKSCRNTNIEGYFHFSSSDKIMSCKLWSKVTSVFLNINFCAKMSILGKKNWISWEMLIFSNNCALLLKVNILLENMLIFRILWLFVWLSIYIKKLSNSDKNFNFLRKFLFVHVLIFIKVFYLWKIVILIQNIISFGDIMDKSVISW